MMVFDEGKLVIADHAVERYLDRINTHMKPSDAEHEIANRVQEALAFKETDDHIYLRYKNLVFPCMKFNGKYTVKTTLTMSMYLNQKMARMDNANEDEAHP